MKKKLYQFIFFKIFNWKINGTIDADIKKCVMIVVPHTSWYDFFIGVFTRGILNLEMNFVAKKELFVFPFNFFFSYMGGSPLNRSKNENRVDAIAKIFNQKDVFRLAIAPEGTRSKVTEWRTGFYYIAKKANVPIIPIAFDYGTKQVIIHKPFYTTNSIENDLKYLQSLFKNVVGKFPEKSFTVN